MTERTIVLASASPRRAELLARMGVSFVVDAADVDESCEGSAWEVVTALARRKAAAAAGRHPNDIILAADTVVLCGSILGKPEDSGDARRMLETLSGRWHEVYTGVCICKGAEMRFDAAVTRVHFTPMTQEEISRYIATGEPMDKAGAYGIQGMAGMFIDRIDGCPFNVMGLPLSLTKQLLTF